MSVKVYTLTGIDSAVKMLRPGARWEIYNNRFTLWEDPRPCPSMEEVMETVEKIKAFEDSINTIWLPNQLEEFGINEEIIGEYISNAD
jgi:hypothetical protein